MSAKDRFLKELSDKKQLEDESKRNTLKLINEFVHEMSLLCENIRIWLDGVPVTVTKRKERISDSTIPFHEFGTYEITHLVINNGNKRIEVSPNSLFLIGASGLVNITITNPSRTPSLNGFKLYMKDSRHKDSNGWCLYKNNLQNQQPVILNEDTFFSTIMTLIS